MNVIERSKLLALVLSVTLVGQLGGFGFLPDLNEDQIQTAPSAFASTEQTVQEPPAYITKWLDFKPSECNYSNDVKFTAGKEGAVIINPEDGLRHADKPYAVVGCFYHVVDKKGIYNYEKVEWLAIFVYDSHESAQVMFDRVNDAIITNSPKGQSNLNLIVEESTDYYRLYVGGPSWEVLLNEQIKAYEKYGAFMETAVQIHRSTLIANYALFFAVSDPLKDPNVPESNDLFKHNRLELHERAMQMVDQRLGSSIDESELKVVMKHTRKLTLVSVRNNSDLPLYAVSLHYPDEKIQLMKVKGWNVERIDENTVMVGTSDRPINPGNHVIILLLTENHSVMLEWSVSDGAGNVLAKGTVSERSL
jgi:hypothetical protein